MTGKDNKRWEYIALGSVMLALFLLLYVAASLIKLEVYALALVAIAAIAVSILSVIAIIRRKAAKDKE